MGTITVNKEELFNVAQNLNLVRIKSFDEDTSIVTPILFASDESIDVLIDMDKVSGIWREGQKVMVKFQKSGFEYLVDGEISGISSKLSATMTMKLYEARKFNNLRRYIRFDTNLKVFFELEEGRFEGVAKNLSKGGAMVSTEKDLPESLPIKIHAVFDSGASFSTTIKVLRRSRVQQNYMYGIQFTDIPEEGLTVLNREISMLERDYFRSLNMLKEYNKKSDVYLDTKIVILSYDADESYEIREELVKLGAENFQLYSNFKFYVDFFIEEKPKIAVIDANVLDEEISVMVKSIYEGFPEIDVILLIPMHEGENECIKFLPAKTTVLYKPLICNEFEEIIIKYL
ncbi:MAG: PilZ domain-containing protein [Clostridia bacterium]|nr:PilZ domain-containing protein [Clostridia bacterium]